MEKLNLGGDCFNGKMNAETASPPLEVFFYLPNLGFLDFFHSVV